MKQFQARHGLEGTEMVIAADAGMLSSANLKDLDSAGCQFIVGSLVTKAPGGLESHFHWHGDKFAGGQTIFRRHPTARTLGRQRREEAG